MNKTRIALVALALISAQFAVAPISAATPDNGADLECVFVAEIGGFRCPVDTPPGSLSSPSEGLTVKQGSGGYSSCEEDGSCWPGHDGTVPM